MELYNLFSTAGIGFTVFFILYWSMRRPKEFPPGPWAFPIVGVLPYLIFSKKDMPHLLIDWSKRYGRIFSIKIGAMTMVILNDFESIQKALHHPDLQGRPEVGFEFITNILDGAKGIAANTGTSWKVLRQYFVTKFREFGIGKSSYEEVVASEASLLMEEIKRKGQAPFNPRILLSYAVSNVINKVALGKQFDYGDPTFKKLHKIVEEDMANLGFLSLLSMFPLLGYLPLPQKKIVERNVTEYKNWFSDIIKHHKDNYDEDNIDDLIYAFMQKMRQVSSAESEIFTEGNLVASIGDLFVAGMDTTTTTLQWAILLLIRSPEVQKSCQKQLDDTIGRSKLPCFSDRPSLPYIQATIAEVQRIANIAPIGVSHMAEKDVKILGYTFPKGTIIQPNLHALMMDPEQWPEPKQFKPERHLDQDGKFVKPITVLPFGTGGRQCLGEHLARMELYVFLTHLLHRFTFKVPEDGDMPTDTPVFQFSNKPVPFEVCAYARE